MRILMIIDGLSGGGAEKVVLTLSEGFLKMGHRISIFSLRKECDYPIPKKIDFQIIQDNCKNPLCKLTEISRRAKLLDYAIIRSEYNGKFDIIFSHLYNTDRIVAHSRVLKNDKVWFCIHSMFSFSYLNNRSYFSRYFKNLEICRTYEHRNIVAVSSAVLENIRSTLAIPIHHYAVINNPFDIDAIQYQAQEPFEMQGQDYLIHVGRFHQNKRHDRLLRAYALSKIQAPLVMMGNDTENRITKLKVLAKKLGIIKRVLFREFSPNPYPWIKGARLLVLNSDCEGFGNVLIEAIICKTPVVSTKCPGGPTEILTGPLARGLSELNDESLAKTLIDIYHHPIIGNDATLSSYAVDKVCKKYIALIKNCH